MTTLLSTSERERQFVARVEALMEETMKKYDPSHDALHVKRVRRTALSLARQLDPQPDLLVVELAALMHDLADKKYVKLPEGTTLYEYFLPTFGAIKASTGDVISEDRLREVVRIIENVSWTTEKGLISTGGLTDWHRQCAELHCVQDADRLDAIGAFGIMRCAAYSAVTNRPLYLPLGEEAPFGANGSAIAHFHEKLLLIKDRLKTPVGRQMGEKRHQLLLDFLLAVQEEYECL